MSMTFIALRALHAAGWVHRDISVSNILIDDKGNPRLCDFEYAMRMDSTAEVHKVRTVS